MKTKIPSVLVLGILAFALPAEGQTPPRPQRQMPPPQPIQAPPIPQPTQPRGVPGGQAQQQNAGELPHNVKLTLEGSLFGTIPTDFSVTTGGTTVSTDMSLGSDSPLPTLGTFEATIAPGEPWLVKVSIGARVPLKNGNNIEYRDFTLSTTVRIAPGKKVVLWQKGEQKLTLSLEKVEE